MFHTRRRKIPKLEGKTTFDSTGGAGKTVLHPVLADATRDAGSLRPVQSPEMALLAGWAAENNRPGVGCGAVRGCGRGGLVPVENRGFGLQ